MEEALRIRRSLTFDRIAELYDRGRREVPEHVFRSLLSHIGMEPSAVNVLEIGCGTGQATLPLARRGCTVTSIEMGANLARIAAQKLAAFPRVSIVNARFEDWNPQDRLFDVVFSANAWHWLDPRLRYARAAAALHPGGVLAFTKAISVFPVDYDPFFEAIQDCYEEIGVERLAFPPPPPEAAPDSRKEIEQSGLFCNIEVLRRLTVEEFTADEYIGLMATASDHRLMSPEHRDWLFGQMRRLIDGSPGGRIRKHTVTLLHIAHRM